MHQKILLVKCKLFATTSSLYHPHESFIISCWALITQTDLPSCSSSGLPTVSPPPRNWSWTVLLFRSNLPAKIWSLQYPLSINLYYFLTWEPSSLTLLHRPGPFASLITQVYSYLITIATAFILCLLVGLNPFLTLTLYLNLNPVRLFFPTVYGINFWSWPHYPAFPPPLNHEVNGKLLLPIFSLPQFL